MCIYIYIDTLNLILFEDNSSEILIAQSKHYRRQGDQDIVVRYHSNRSYNGNIWLWFTKVC